jgi:hypothetical protein
MLQKKSRFLTALGGSDIQHPFLTLLGNGNKSLDSFCFIASFLIKQQKIKCSLASCG